MIVWFHFKNMRVGFYVKPGKWDKMNMAHFVETAKSHGIDIIRIDLNQDLELQGPFDLIVHKSIDLFVQSKHFNNKKADEQLKNLEKYSKAHPSTPFSNPLPFDDLVTSRKRIFDELSKLDFKGDCIVPDLTIKTCKYVIKTDLACGAESAHKFEFKDSIDFDPKAPDAPFVQPFFDAGDAVVKVYGIGHYTKVNIKNSKNIELNIDMAAVERVADVLRKGLGCELFGFDLIQDIQTKKWYIIDLNSFSGIEVIPGFEEMMIDFFKKKVSR